MNTKNRGFTLIELTVAIVILGILAVIAVPTYQKLASDARISTLEAAAAAMRATSNQIKIKSEMPNTPKVLDQARSTPTIKVYDVTLEALSAPQPSKTYNGYVDANWQRTWRYALDLGINIGLTTGHDQKCIAHDLCGVGNRRPGVTPGFPAFERTHTEAGVLLIWPEGFFLTDLCYAYYNNPLDGTEPTVGTVTSGC